MDDGAYAPEGLAVIEGLLAGISSGLAVFAARLLTQGAEYENTNCF